MPLKRRKYGNTGLKVTPLGFGAGHIGDPHTPDHQVEKLLHTLLDSGINLIDTAKGYGLSEERIGKFIAHRRDEYILSTKVGYGIEGIHDWTYDCIIAGVDLARKTLRTGKIDIVHLHSCNSDILRNNGVLDALNECKNKGWISVSAYSGENSDLQEALNSGLIQAMQTSVNLFDQKSLNDYIPQAEKAGFGVIGKRSLGNVPWIYDEQPYGNYAEQYWLRMKELAYSVDMDYPELAIRFAAYSPGVSSAIIGTNKIESLKSIITAAEKGPLPKSVYRTIRNRYLEIGKHWEGLI